MDRPKSETYADFKNLRKAMLLSFVLLSLTGCGKLWSNVSPLNNLDVSLLHLYSATWISGSDTVTHAGVYGTLGTPSSSTMPGTRSSAASWTDSSGNLWLFGGDGLDSTGTEGDLNDLWKFNPTSNQWTWMGGSNVANQAGVYGTKGTGSTSNIPGGRVKPIFWNDTSGNFWLFGGGGYDVNDNGNYMNDLWKFDPGNGQWTWVSGPDTCGGGPTYGTLGTGSVSNTPGGRSSPAGWTDASGNLWLFGGTGIDNNNAVGYLNDLWKFSPINSQWTWVNGSNTITHNGVYGTKGTPGPSNIPGTRDESMSWTDASGNLWLFGGYGIDSVGSSNLMNDLWNYNIGTGQWVWVSGSSFVNQSGVYGALNVPSSTNIPGARAGSDRWIDTSGNLWILGGIGSNAEGTQNDLNDMWRYNINTGLWAWIGGDTVGPETGIFGTSGVGAYSNFPGGRQRGLFWTDASGDFWVFGGVGYDSNGNINTLNDLWKITH